MSYSFNIQGALVIVELNKEQEGFLIYRGGLIEKICLCEQDGKALRLALYDDVIELVFPRLLAPAFLRYTGNNPLELDLQKTVAEILTT